jgi:hypothetical protein
MNDKNECDKTKEAILTRLYEFASKCSFCGEECCAHGGNRHLKDNMTRGEVLKAIDLK